MNRPHVQPCRAAETAFFQRFLIAANLPLLFYKDDADVGADHNFYWTDDGDLVIIFDKYEVGPGSMGTPEFTIEKEVIDKILKSDYKNLMS